MKFSTKGKCLEVAAACMLVVCGFVGYWDYRDGQMFQVFLMVVMAGVNMTTFLGARKLK
jgi:NADH:ubiquinone oxidoreductase subunit K